MKRTTLLLALILAPAILYSQEKSAKELFYDGI
jgi:hypothetical protein